jgi:hypothetical protein
MNCPFCDTEADNIQLHCITVHSNLTPLSYLTENNTLEQSVCTYKHFLFLCILFHNSGFHQDVLDDALRMIHQGKTLKETVDKVLEDWGGEFHPFYAMDYS